VVVFGILAAALLAAFFGLFAITLVCE